jgi:hypothetical protein
LLRLWASIIKGVDIPSPSLEARRSPPIRIRVGGLRKT